MRRPLFALLAAAAVIAFLIFGGLRWVLWHTLFAPVARQEAALKSPAMAKASGRELARLCQTCKAHPDWFADEPPLAPAWTPSVILAKDPRWVSIEPEAARVEFGGGFHHFGYQLATGPNTASAGGQAAWVLSFYSEDAAEVVLDRFTLAADDVLTEQQFVDRALGELDRRIATNEDARLMGDPDSYATVQRCKFALKHHSADRLRAAIRKSAAHNVGDWRDVLLAYLIDRPADASGAMDRLRQWATARNEFSGWLMAAYAFDEAGDAAAERDAVTRACRFPADDAGWVCGNARYRGLALCRRLYARGLLTECATLCDMLLAYTGSQNYLASEIGAIRAACRDGSATRPALLAPADDGILFNPFAGIDLAALGPEPTSQPARARTLK